METPKTVFFLGKPGSGKGTQARVLAEKTGWRMFGSGEQLRALALEDTYVGRKTRVQIDGGTLSPPWFIRYLYLKTLFSVPLDEHVIFDGFNRKVDEAELIFTTSEFLGRSFIVLDIVVSDDEVRRRLHDRKHTSGRADDHAVERRLEEYQRYTEKALEVFREGGRCVAIDGERPPEDVAKDVQEALGLV